METTANPVRDTVVIGASAGGPSALGRLLERLPERLEAAILIVQHQSPRLRGHLVDVLRLRSRRPVDWARHGGPLTVSTIQVAPPDRRLILGSADRVELTAGPQENRVRPAINTLFRSAAVHRSSRVIGVLLTGMLDDGVAGLAAIQACGGIAVVQDPDDAEFSEMPRHALGDLEIDHVATLAGLPRLLETLVGEPAKPAVVPRDLWIEAQLTTGGLNEFDEPAIGELVAIACPECGGPLRKSGDGHASVFRCRIGHASSPESMLEGQSVEVEHSLWAALRSLEDRVRVLRSLEQDAGRRGQTSSVESYRHRAVEATAHARRAREFILGLVGQLPRTGATSDRDVAAAGQNPPRQ